MNIPDELVYTKEHEWISIEGNIATIGITDWAQGELGDIVFVELPETGETIKQESTFGTIEAVKAVSELYAPISGVVTEINPALDDDPMAINRDAYGDGWMIKIDMSDPSQIEQLLSPVGYRELIDE